MSVADDIVTHVRLAAGHLKEASDAMTSAVSDCVTTGVNQGTRESLEFAHQQAAHMKRELLLAHQIAKGNRTTDVSSLQRVKGADGEVLGMAHDDSPGRATANGAVLGSGQESVGAFQGHDVGEGEWQPTEESIEPGIMESGEGDPPLVGERFSPEEGENNAPNGGSDPGDGDGESDPARGGGAHE